jgi:glycosyltransferase involved in cell wall biosynthesis/SAM-dependent methyltransferase
VKVAFFSPLPPAKSGIADYSAALLSELGSLVDVTTFSARPQQFDPAQFDIALYQVGNNAHHDFCYEMALEHPGVVVVHEGNLHHLITDLTIRRGEWDTYMREVEFEGGVEALRYAERVRRLEVGPDYEGVPMLRRLLSRSKAAIVHSECVRGELRKAGFSGPIARIPHGAWIPQADRNAYRFKLGLDESTPLIGIFGFLKPYKRIAESLRAFRRLVRLEPSAKMILVGEPHPELPLRSLIRALDLDAQVRVLGFTPIEDFTGYIAACDIVLNLRYPTVGENSGTLMRALGLGKAVLVSDVGSFCEYPDNVCLKVSVDAAEEDTIFEYLNVLVSRREVRDQLGESARSWVESECSWPLVAKHYHHFLDSVITGKSYEEPSPRNAFAAAVAAGNPAIDIEPSYITSWASDAAAQSYIETHLTRLTKTLAITPRGTPADRILEMGAYLQITPALKTRLCYGEVRGCYYGAAGHTERRRATSTDGEAFECDVDFFDAEKDRFPYDDGYFSTVICGELIEHLFEDPMHLMSEINRILKPGGHVVLTTPNICSLRAISAILQGYHPGFFQSYIRPAEPGQEADARHNREYTPQEISLLLMDSGFEKTLLETGPFRDEPKPEHAWVLNLLDRYYLPKNLRGDGIYAVGRKVGLVRNRYPAWLFS